MRRIFLKGGVGMKVEVRLFAYFRDGKWKKQEMEFQNGSTLEHIVKEIGIKLPEAGKYAAGMVFLPRDPALRLQCEGILERAAI
jgi:glutamate synthase domain-containing protein 1